MVDITPHRIGQKLYARLPRVEFSVVASALGVGLYLVSTFALATPVWGLVAYGAIIALVSKALWSSYPHAVFGLCNTITLVRATFLALLVGVLFEAQTGAPWLVFWVASLVLVLDGVDGWIARRTGLQSEFGARFDMETDAALGAILALYLLITGKTGAEVLVLGFMRYAFVVAGWIWSDLRGDLPASFRRKAICVIQISALIILVFPLTPSVLVAPVTIMASVLLVVSFAIDSYWLIQNKT